MPLTSESTTSFSSTSPILNRRTNKDYQAGLANLQTVYGFGGAVPTPIQNPTSTSKQPSAAASQKAPRPSSSSSAASKTQSAPTISSSKKDYKAACAALLSDHGFGGQSPASGSQRKS